MTKLNSIISKNCINLNQNASLILALGLIVFSLSLLLTSNNDDVAGFSSTTNGPTHITVRINPGAFNPKSLHPLNASIVTVPVGSTVTWVNNDIFILGNPDHIIISGDPNKGPSNDFYSPLIGIGKNFSVRFNNTGVYPYYDGNYAHIKGQVIVNPVTPQR